MFKTSGLRRKPAKMADRPKVCGIGCVRWGVVFDRNLWERGRDDRSTEQPESLPEHKSRFSKQVGYGVNRQKNGRSAKKFAGLGACGGGVVFDRNLWERGRDDRSTELPESLAEQKSRCSKQVGYGVNRQKNGRSAKKFAGLGACGEGVVFNRNLWERGRDDRSTELPESLAEQKSRCSKQVGYGVNRQKNGRSAKKFAELGACGGGVVFDRNLWERGRDDRSTELPESLPEHKSRFSKQVGYGVNRQKNGRSAKKFAGLGACGGGVVARPPFVGARAR